PHYIPYTPYHRSLTSFFFSCDRPRRLLLSFPTRRSSDLILCFGIYLLHEPLLMLVYGLIGQSVAYPVLGDLQSAAATTIALSATDRKSTRLNSSHLGISYAVFCLKKKKKKSRETTTAHTT